MKKEITAIGEVLIDIYGNEKKIGGAPFNFIYHMTKLGFNSNFISAIGNDKNGKIIQELISNQNINDEYVKQIQDKPSGEVRIKLSKEKVPKYSIRTDVAYDYIEVSKNEKRKIVKISDLVYFGTLAQRNLVSKRTIHSLLGKNSINFYDLNLRQSFYSKQIIRSSLKKCNILKLNEEELKFVATLFFDRSSILKLDVLKIMELFEISIVAVTRGEKGAILFSIDSSAQHKPKIKNVIDTVGAGDAYSAILAAGILNNIKLSKINRLAVSFSSEVCNVKGALLKNDKIYEIYRRKLSNEK